LLVGLSCGVGSGLDRGPLYGAVVAVLAVAFAIAVCQFIFLARSGRVLRLTADTTIGRVGGCSPRTSLSVSEVSSGTSSERGSSE
jgi:hypothetical protein